MNPIHRCKIHVHSIDPSKLEVMGMDHDPGKWLPFSFHMGTVIACKMSTDEPELLAYGCTTIFTAHGDSYIIDTPFEEFDNKFIRYNDENEDSGPSNREVQL